MLFFAAWGVLFPWLPAQGLGLRLRVKEQTTETADAEMLDVMSAYAVPTRPIFLTHILLEPIITSLEIAGLSLVPNPYFTQRRSTRTEKGKAYCEQNAS